MGDLQLVHYVALSILAATVIFAAVDTVLEKYR